MIEALCALILLPFATVSVVFMAGLSLSIVATVAQKFGKNK